MTADEPMSTPDSGGLRVVLDRLTRRVGTIDAHASDAAAVLVNTGDLRHVLRWLAAHPEPVPTPDSADDATVGEREDGTCRTCGHVESLHVGIAGPCEACARGKRNRSHVGEFGPHDDCARFAQATPPADDANRAPA